MSDEDTRVTRAPLEMATFEELKLQTQKLDQFYKGLMVLGTDYGIIPGTKKPTLLKPGAELLRIWAGLTPEFEIDNTGTDLERGIFAYQITCSLYNKETRLIGQGVGFCSSLEAKYRYRWLSDRELPPGIDKSNLVFKERTSSRTGGKWRVYRVENDNPQDQANTVLKIAKKRAFVDGILTVTGAGRIFTQDIEDMVDDADQAQGPPDPQGKGKTTPKTQAKGKDQPAGKKTTTEAEAEPPAENKETAFSTFSDASITTGEEAQAVADRMMAASTDDEQKKKLAEKQAAIKSLADMYQHCWDDFQMQPADVMAELNVKSNIEIKETPAECYARIAGVRQPKEGD